MTLSGLRLPRITAKSPEYSYSVYDSVYGPIDPMPRVDIYILVGYDLVTISRLFQYTQKITLLHNVDDTSEVSRLLHVKAVVVGTVVLSQTLSCKLGSAALACCNRKHTITQTPTQSQRCALDVA